MEEGQYMRCGAQRMAKRRVRLLPRTQQQGTAEKGEISLTLMCRWSSMVFLISSDPHTMHGVVPQSCVCVREWSERGEQSENQSQMGVKCHVCQCEKWNFCLSIRTWMKYLPTLVRLNIV
jgi:hypothetical protein